MAATVVTQVTAETALLTLRWQEAGLVLVPLGMNVHKAAIKLTRVIPVS